MNEASLRSSLSGDVAACIVAVAERRDRESFIALFTYFAPKVKAYLLRSGVKEPTAEELTQETLFTVWRKADRFDPVNASPAGWIYTIARNLLVDWLRRERLPCDGRIDEPPAAPVTPEEQLGTAEGMLRLRTAIRGLPSEQAKILQMAFFEDRTHIQIAEIIGLPLGTVKSRIRLATAHLKLALEGLV